MSLLKDLAGMFGSGNGSGSPEAGVQKKTMTVLFADVAGFQSVSMTVSPEILVECLAEYFQLMGDIILDQGGTLHHFLGDAIHCFWNFPADQPDHAVRACTCALRMQAELGKHQERWSARGVPRVAVRMGINTGKAAVGYLGPARDLRLVCLGDEVNLAARLEKKNRELGTDILIGEETQREVKDRFVIRFIEFIPVMGRREPGKIFQLLAEQGKAPAWWSGFESRYHAALGHHFAGRFKESLDLFQALTEQFPQDVPCQIYLQRNQELLQNPPPDGWDGTWFLPAK